MKLNTEEIEVMDMNFSRYSCEWIKQQKETLEW